MYECMGQSQRARLCKLKVYRLCFCFSTYMASSPESTWKTRNPEVKIVTKFEYTQECTEEEVTGSSYLYDLAVSGIYIIVIL